EARGQRESGRVIVADVRVREDQSLLGVDDHTGAGVTAGIDLDVRSREFVAARSAAPAPDEEHDAGDDDRDEPGGTDEREPLAAGGRPTLLDSRNLRRPFAGRDEHDALAGFGITEPRGLRSVDVRVGDAFAVDVRAAARPEVDEMPVRAVE